MYVNTHKQGIIIQAHRGASKQAPENTMSAFIKAIELGADGIELDVRFTSDRKLVVIHDATVDRTSNGRGEVKNMTLNELLELDFGAWFASTYKNEKIVTLNEVLEMICGHSWQGLINIEIKGAGSNDYDEINNVIPALLRQYRLIKKTIISSFNHNCLINLKRNCAEIITGLLYSEDISDPVEYAELTGADAIHPNYRYIDTNKIMGCHNKGIMVNPWTIDSINDMMNIASMGADSIITNYPDIAMSVLKAPCQI